MIDAALSTSPTPAVTSPLSLLSSTSATPPGTTGIATTADPFAALLASATDSPAALKMAGAKATPMPIILIGMDPATLPAASGEPTPQGEKSDSGSEDPLGDAIASGATAVLALAPTIAAPVAPVIAPPVTPIATQPAAPTPPQIQIDAPIAQAGPRKFPITPAAPTPARAIAAATLPTILVPARDEAAATTAKAGLPTAAPTIGATVAMPITAGRADIANNGARPGDPQAGPNDQGKPGTPAPASEAVARAPKDVIEAVMASTQTGAAIVSGATAPQAQTVAPQAATTAPDAALPTAQPVQAQARNDIQMPAPRGTAQIGEAVRVDRNTRKRVDAPSIELAPIGLAQRAADVARTPDAAAATVAPKGDAIVQQTLTVARDGAWLDRLARDIAHSAGSGNDLHFKLEPQNLGALTVAISQTIDGASIRMTAETDTTRKLLHDAQPTLIAEARAQGLKVSETHVELGNQRQQPDQDTSRWAQHNASSQQNNAQNGQNRQSSPAHQPFVSNLGRKAEDEAESPARDSDALYA